MKPHNFMNQTRIAPTRGGGNNKKSPARALIGLLQKQIHIHRQSWSCQCIGKRTMGFCVTARLHQSQGQQSVRGQKFEATGTTQTRFEPSHGRLRNRWHLENFENRWSLVELGGRCTISHIIIMCTCPSGPPLGRQEEGRGPPGVLTEGGRHGMGRHVGHGAIAISVLT